ncbi:MAG: PKD domain-containing protein [Bacteroidota bacterium]
MRIKLYLLLFSLVGISNIFSQTQTNIVVDALLDGTTTNTCNGFIIDSGGQGGDGYDNNEDVTFTVCADNPDDIINVQFNLFALDPTDQNPAPNVTNVDLMSVFDGNSTAAISLGDYSANQLQGVLIQCTPQNTSGCLTFRFTSNNVGNPGFFSASAACITPCDDPTAGGVVLSGITTDSIHACIGETISFQDLGSFAQPGFTIAEYKWDFMDGAEALGQNVNHSYTVAGHYRVQLFVKDNNGCTNNNLIDIDVLVATPPNFINFQGDTTLCIGESMLATATPLLYENTWTGFSGETLIDNGCMTDNQLGVAQNVDVVQTGFSAGTTITDISQIVSLCMDMEHTYIGDLVISISCPNGQSVILHQQNSGSTYLGEPNEQDNVDCDDPTTQGVPFSYCFTSDAIQTWSEYEEQNQSQGESLPAGDYEPIQSLGGLVGCPANGVWTLTVVDNFSADDGTVFSFALNLDPSLYPDVVEFTPSHSPDLDSSYWTFPVPFSSGLSPSADTMLITPTQTGVFSYQYNVINSFGCMNDTTFNITVTEFTLPVVLSDTAVCPGSSISMINGSQNNCNYTLKLYDSFGDGWNGNNLKVSVNGTNTTHTIPNDGDFAQFQIPVSFGDNLVLTFDGAGSFIYECSYELLNCSGQVIVNGESELDTQPVVLQVGLPVSEPVAFEWSPADVFGTQVNSTNPFIAIPNDIDVTLKMYPIAHPLCFATGNMKVSLHPNSFPGVDSTVSFCLTTDPEDFHQFLGPGASVTGQWLAPDGSFATMPIAPLNMLQGDYIYNVNTNGCIGQATITVADFEQQIIPILSCPKPNICLGEEVVFYDLTTSNDVANTFLTFGDGYSLNYGLADTMFTHLYDSIKSYSLTMTVTSQMGCVYSNNFDNMISVKQAPKANFFVNPDVITTYEPKANLFSQSSADAVKFEWDLPGAEIDTANTENTKATYPLGIAGEYLATLTVENFYGCRDSIAKTILIQDDLLMYIPNSFTPNGDIHNNTWEIAINGADPNRFSLKVFNRWGQLIFESNDPKAAWDGTYGNGGLVQDGMYQWRINGFNTLTNQEFERSGYLNIFK